MSPKPQTETQSPSSQVLSSLISLAALGLLIWWFAPTLLPTSLRADHRVRYELSGTARSASITIQNESGGSEQHTVAVPWARDFTVKEGTFVYLSAQNQGGAGRHLKAAIFVDGKVLQEAESTEEYGIASVSGAAQ